MAVRHIFSQRGLQPSHQGGLWTSSVSLQKSLFSVSRSSFAEPDRPDEREVSRRVSRFVIQHSSLSGIQLHVYKRVSSQSDASNEFSLSCSKRPRIMKYKRPE